MTEHERYLYGCKIPSEVQILYREWTNSLDNSPRQYGDNRTSGEKAKQTRLFNKLSREIKKFDLDVTKTIGVMATR